MTHEVARRGWGWLLVVGLSLVGLPARAQEYVIGAEDVLQVSVWMHPELERTVTVSSDGDITYPPVGNIKAAGATPAQLATRIGDKLSAYLRQATTVTVTVTQYMSHSVHVQGAVARPGRYGFERIPGLVDVLSAAGGAQPGANLAAVQIVRREGAQRRTLTADVESVLRDGDTSRLPALRAGDMIVVPGGGQAGMVGVGSGAVVLGQVQRPGIYAVPDQADIWGVLAQAGGLTERGSLSDVRILSSDGSGPVTTRGVNLADILRRNSSAPVRIKPGDVVFVGSAGGFGRAWTGFASFLVVSRDILNIWVLADILRRE